MILALRTDKPEAELYLCDQQKAVDTFTWQAHRELSDTLLAKIELLLYNNKLNLADIHAVAIYKGPGSFTGLRIGLTVANTLAYSLNVPIEACSGDAWLQDSLKKLNQQTIFTSSAQPFYGSQAHITAPRK